MTNLCIDCIQPHTESEARCDSNDECEWQAAPTLLAPVQFSLLMNQEYHPTHRNRANGDQDDIEQEPKVKPQDDPGLSED